MKKAKYTMALALSLIIAATAMSGCASKSADSSAKGNLSSGTTGAVSSESAVSNLNLEGYPIVKEKITLKMMGSKASIQGPWEDLAFFKGMEEMTNIHFEFDTPASDVYQEKKNIAFASGDYPDVFFGSALTDSDEITYGPGQKILLPLNDLLDKYAPNLTAYLDANPDVRQAITHSDGNIYAIPQIQEAIWCLTPIVWFNEKWCDNLGLEVPTTTDELYDVLKAFKEQDANGNGDATDEIPATGAGIFGGLMGAFGLSGESTEVVDDDVRFNPMTDNYKAFLEYTAKLYSDGLLDNESFTQTEQQVKAKGVEMKLGMFTHAAAWLVCPPEKDNDYVALKPLKSSVTDAPVAQLYNKVIRGTFAMTVNNPNPEAMIRWVDYLFSEQGGTESRYGYENVHWEWVNDEHTSFRKIIPDGMNGEEYRGGQITPDCGTSIPNIASVIFQALEYNENPPYTSRLVEQSESLSPYLKAPFPQTYYSAKQNEDIAALSTDLNTYVSQMRARFITGEEPLTENSWNTYVDTLKRMNVERYIEIYQEIYDGLSK